MHCRREEKRWMSKKKWLDYIKDWTRLSVDGLVGLTQSRTQWRRIVDDVHTSDRHGQGINNDVNDDDVLRYCKADRGAVAGWVRPLDWRLGGLGFESRCSNFPSEQFRLPRCACVFQRIYWKPSFPSIWCLCQDKSVRYMVRFISELISNHSVVVKTSYGQQRRLKSINNGVPQRFVDRIYCLSPMLFNVYIADLP